MKTIAKVFISLVLICLLVVFYGSEELAARIVSISLIDIIVLTLLCTVSLMILARRFQFVMASGCIDERWSEVFSLQLMGLSLNQFMPGIYGGDLLRAAYFMPNHRGKGRYLTAAVIFERINGLLAMIVLGSISSVYMGAVTGQQKWLLIGMFLAIILLSAGIGAVAIYLFWREKVMLFKWLRLSQEVVQILAGLFRMRKVFGVTFLLSIMSQAVSISAYYYLAVLFQAELPLTAVACAVSLAWLTTVIPVSLNGLGLRESGLVVVMISFGAPQAAALSVSLTALIPTIIHAAMGMVLLALNYSAIRDLKQLFEANQELLS